MGEAALRLYVVMRLGLVSGGASREGFQARGKELLRCSPSRLYVMILGDVALF